MDTMYEKKDTHFFEYNGDSLYGYDRYAFERVYSGILFAIENVYGYTRIQIFLISRNHRTYTYLFKSTHILIECEV